MPRKNEWTQRLNLALETLQDLPAHEILDRTAIETTFRVKPRQATRIMNKLGAKTLGGALVIRCSDLIARLELLQQDVSCLSEQRRRERLAEKLNAARLEARGRRIVISQPEEVPDGPLAMRALPPQIRLSPGQLQVEFSHATELLQHLLLLARTISEDWAAFEGVSTVRG